MSAPDERGNPSPSEVDSRDQPLSVSIGDDGDEMPSLQSRPRTNSTSSTSSQSSSASSSSSSSSLPSAAFLPPFYNRPPTPLPPSPSLTSLLRPPFTPSRPLTPESSDSESLHSNQFHQQLPPPPHHHLHNQNDNLQPSISSSSSASFLPLSSPLPSPRVPTYEYYGFVLYLTSTFSFGIYILWSYLPESVLNYFGIYYYYNRWWSLAVPAYLVITVLYIFVALAGWNTEVMAKNFEDLECITDKVAKIAVVEVDERRHIHNHASSFDSAVALKNEVNVEQKEERISQVKVVVVGEEGFGGASSSTTKHAKKRRKHRKKKKSKRRGSGWTSGSASENMDEADWYYYGSSTAHEDTDDAEGGDGETEGMKASGVHWKEYWSTHTDAVLDIPIGGVCEVLYGEGREER